MQIAYINPQAVPGLLPSALQILQFADALAGVGNQVTLLTPAAADGLRAEQLLGRPAAAGLTFAAQTDHRRRWYFPFSSNRPFHWQAISWLRKHPADVIYVRNLKLAKALLDSGITTPIFFETHELFAESFREHHQPLSARGATKLATLRALEGEVYRRVAGLLPITHGLREDIEKAYAPGINFLVVPDAVDPRLAAAALGGNVAAARRPVLLYLGSLHRWKGVEVLLSAMPMVAGADLLVAGGNPARIAELQAHPALAGDPGRVRFLGAIPPLQRFNLIATADICLLPLAKTSIGSRYTSPLKLFEYMAMGKAIIASDLPSIREVVADGDAARLVPAEDAPALAAAINQLISDVPLRQRLGARAAELARQYTWAGRAEAVTAWLHRRVVAK